MKRWIYPFAAIVGQDLLKASLLLNAVDSSIGGVLIRGPKGTGKSTAARALAGLLPPIQAIESCPFNSAPEEQNAFNPSNPEKTATPGTVIWRPTPFVELPLNATEDRLAGALHLEKSLQTGSRQFEPGLLAAANRGILYVDEVNLLDDHLVDLLLDAASSGVNIVEREGLSYTHAARFMLIGTMNPEEGELRPQFLDRFGLCVTLEPVDDPGSRERIIRQRLAFDTDPRAFTARWEQDEQRISNQIQIARCHLEQVAIPDSAFGLAARLSQELHVPTHRADITLVRAARAHAALLEKDEVDQEDLRISALVALPHRAHVSPLDSIRQIQARIEKAFDRFAVQPDATPSPEIPDAPSPSDDAHEDVESMAERMQVPGGCAAGSILLDFIKKKSANRSSRQTSG